MARRGSPSRGGRPAVVDFDIATEIRRRSADWRKDVDSWRRQAITGE
jgi:hypothetical protein